MQVLPPKQSDVETELLLFLHLQPRPVSARMAYERLAELMHLRREQRAVKIEAWRYLVRQAKRRLVDTGDIIPLTRTQRDCWALTTQGHERAEAISSTRAIRSKPVEEPDF